jgi:hypothetical protein
LRSCSTIMCGVAKGKAGSCWWLDFEGARTGPAARLGTVDRHPLASVGTLVLGLRCSWCPGGISTDAEAARAVRAAAGARQRNRALRNYAIRCRRPILCRNRSAAANGGLWSQCDFLPPAVWISVKMEPGRARPHPTTTARLRVDNCNDLHRPRVHNYNLIADHEVIIPTPARLDCYDRVWNRNKAD